MRFDPVVTVQEYRSCLKVGLCDSEAILHYPSSCVHPHYGGGVVFDVCTDAAEAVKVVLVLVLLLYLLADLVKPKLMIYFLKGEVSSVEAQQWSSFLIRRPGLYSIVILRLDYFPLWLTLQHIYSSPPMGSSATDLANSSSIDPSRSTIEFLYCYLENVRFMLTFANTKEYDNGKNCNRNNRSSL